MSENVNQGRNTKKGGGDKRIVIIGIVALAVIAVLVGVIVYLLLPKEDEEKRNVVVTKDNVEEVVEEMSQSALVEPGYYETSMTNEWHFANGTAVSGDAYVANVENNTNDIYFDLVLADDEDHVILKSPIIPRGAELTDITLDEDLDPGTYNCVMIYHLIDDDQKSISTLRITVTVIVEG